MKILGLIPARGGSKGIPRKNIKEIAGKPLIAWTIQAAQNSRLLSDFVVSTEDDEIAETARSLGAKVLLRPYELATDYADTLDVMKHVLNNIPADILVLLQATSPIRCPGLIDECIKEFLKNHYDSLATGFLCHYTEYSKNDARRQDIEGFFYDDGNVYVMRADMVLDGDRYGKKIGRKIISRWENVEIDDEFDFWLAEQILKANLDLAGGSCEN
jgi:CMP-N-acetylneuraminic acid synthetase